MDQQFDQVLFLIDIRMEPERIDHFTGKSCLLCNFYVFEKTRPVIIDMEPLWFFDENNICPPPLPGTIAISFLVAITRWIACSIGKRKIGHDDQNLHPQTGEGLN
ncbi:MAG: hypothetical protein MZU79_09255 [Anaerotruncus sp.]|nr:hypothetical protein [Anaerotruncus sp.]